MNKSGNNSTNNRNHHRSQAKKRIAQRQQLPLSSSSLKNRRIPLFVISDYHSNEKNVNPYDQQQQRQIQTITWRKRWAIWFSLCKSEGISHSDLNSKTKSIKKRARTKSENDISKRVSLNQDEKRKFSTTNSNFNTEHNPKNKQEEYLFATSFHQYRRQSNDKANNPKTVLYRNSSRRYSNIFFSSARCTGGDISIGAIPTTNISQQKQPSDLSRSVDRLNPKSHHRQLRYEEHDDYISSPSYPTQYYPTKEHNKKSLNKSIDFFSSYHHNQLNNCQLKSSNNYQILPRPYSSNIPVSHSVQIMSKISSKNHNNNDGDDNNNSNNHAYGKLSECHSPLIPLENSSIKAPRRIESTYGQFPIQQEPIYANTQSLYDNILYPQSATKMLNKTDNTEKISCASQTQLTWTMATFSSFVDLENQSIIIPQPDPSTLYSVVQHGPTRSKSTEAIQSTNRISSGSQYIDDANSSSHYQRPRSPISSNVIQVEKCDGSFQTLLTIAPKQDLKSSRDLLIYASTSSPISTGSSATTGEHHHHHHHHHHHRKHKSRGNTSSNHIVARDVGLQVNIQAVKRITFPFQKSDDSTTVSSSVPLNRKTSPELKHIGTNTESLVTKRDKSTLYETNIKLVNSSSQTFDTTTTPIINRQTKAIQTQAKTLRDQAIETNYRGLFVCDLSTLLANGSDEASAPLSRK